MYQAPEGIESSAGKHASGGEVAVDLGQAHGAALKAGELSNSSDSHCGNRICRSGKHRARDLAQVKRAWSFPHGNIRCPHGPCSCVAQHVAGPKIKKRTVASDIRCVLEICRNTCFCELIGPTGFQAWKRFR